MEQNDVDATPDELLGILSFMPETYTIEFDGVNSRIVVGDLCADAYEYWINGRVDDLLITLNPDEYEDYLDAEDEVPEYAKIFGDDYWDELEHDIDEYGYNATNETTVIVYNEVGGVVLSTDGDVDNLISKSIVVNNTQQSLDLDSLPTGECKYKIDKFSCESHTGIFFLTRPFDPSKLKFNVIELFGEKLIDSVFYCGEEVSLELKSNIEEGHSMDIFKGA